MLVRDVFAFQIAPSQKLTEVTSRDHKASLISPTTEAEGAWKLAEKFITIFASFCQLHLNLLSVTCSIAQFLCCLLYFLCFLHHGHMFAPTLYATAWLPGCVHVKSSAHAHLAFWGLSCWEPSVTLYLWFRFWHSLWLPFVAVFAVLKGLKMTGRIILFQCNIWIGKFRQLNFLKLKINYLHKLQGNF